jgi:cysteine synthase A
MPRQEFEVSGTLPEQRRYLHQVNPTPLVPICLDTHSPVIWCKLEFLNPSGSTKDRIARFILEKAWRQGRLKAGDLVIEASSGSTDRTTPLISTNWLSSLPLASCS